MKTHSKNNQTYLKRGKTQATKTCLVLVLHLIGWVARVLISGPIPMRGKGKPMKSRIAFDIQLKIPLLKHLTWWEIGASLMEHS